jgi:hypothetical protein
MYSMSTSSIFLFRYHCIFAIAIKISLNNAHVFTHNLSLDFHLFLKPKSISLLHSTIWQQIPMNPFHIGLFQPMSSHQATHNKPQTKEWRSKSFA